MIVTMYDSVGVRANCMLEPTTTRNTIQCNTIPSRVPTHIFQLRRAGLRNVIGLARRLIVTFSLVV